VSREKFVYAQCYDSADGYCRRLGAGQQLSLLYGSVIGGEGGGFSRRFFYEFSRGAYKRELLVGRWLGKRFYLGSILRGLWAVHEKAYHWCHKSSSRLRG
jgi:hypothetical protein